MLQMLLYVSKYNGLYIYMDYLIYHVYHLSQSISYLVINNYY